MPDSNPAAKKISGVTPSLEKINKPEGAMSLTQWLFGRDTSKPKQSADGRHSKLNFPHSQNSKGTNSPQGVRKELLRLALRESLKHNGIPANWISADALVATATGRQPGIHVRLVMKHWDARLPVHAMAFQQNFETRLLTLDPLATSWLMGISWQYELPADADWPRMPHPGTWTAAPQAEPQPAPLPQDAPPSARPVMIRTRAELEQELANDDKRFQPSQSDFAATQAGSYAATQPASL
jgi:hypothetical protein